MARWSKIKTRGNVEDRRSMSSAGIGGISITGIAVVLLMNYLSGGSAIDAIDQIQQQSFTPQEVVDTSEFEGQDDYEVFVSTVLGSNNALWQEIFSKQNKTYKEPRLVLFRNATQSGCGVASSQVGPHYCPVDSTIYIDETFFDELQRRFGAQGGDVAEAYVIGHEVAHHAQHELGLLSNRGSNQDSINTELQADCFAGLWAHSIKDAGVFLPGEIKEAMNAASAVGDDRIQSKTTGQINKESWTHGSSEARVNAFTTGFETGDFNECK